MVHIPGVALNMESCDIAAAAAAAAAAVSGGDADSEVGEEVAGDNGSGGLQGCDALGAAIASTLGAVMSEFDSAACGATCSQDQLSLSIDSLTGELDKLLEGAPLPLIMKHSARISSICKRVSAMNLLLRSIQRRIDNIDYMISSGRSIEGTPTNSSASL